VTVAVGDMAILGAKPFPNIGIPSVYTGENNCWLGKLSGNGLIAAVG
jgi:hypothetical protein